MACIGIDYQDDAFVDPVIELEAEQVGLQIGEELQRSSWVFPSQIPFTFQLSEVSTIAHETFRTKSGMVLIWAILRRKFWLPFTSMPSNRSKMEMPKM
ncbi:hypothetical protein [Algoriphagus sp. Y33]|uniref:hypothetical protein n=1 Tax=Algoriphagus sp. Y33 TaxID=2772483 RepID=UPI00177C38E1|nr:hypothetical protein [Algoriphagus sp. Y33]